MGWNSEYVSANNKYEHKSIDIKKKFFFLSIELMFYTLITIYNKLFLLSYVFGCEQYTHLLQTTQQIKINN